jgi:hypothetical protein
VLAVLEKYALHYRNVVELKEWENRGIHGELLDETGTVETAGLVQDSGGEKG